MGDELTTLPIGQQVSRPGQLDPEQKRLCELAAENVVIAYETARGWECTRVGHEKIGFDIRSMGPPDPQTGYRDPVTSIRRIVEQAASFFQKSEKI